MRRPSRRVARMRRLMRRLHLARIVATCGLFAVGLMAATMSRPAPRPLTIAPLVVSAPLRLPAVVVDIPKPGPIVAPKPAWKLGMGAAPAGTTVPVQLTAYCLKGTTRRGRYVRPGIVAADPKLFPLARYLEIYVGKKYLGRFLIDDTGGAIKGPIIDIWTPTCREAILFGRRKGTATLVPKGAPADSAPVPDVANLMSYVRRR